MNQGMFGINIFEKQQKTPNVMFLQVFQVCRTWQQILRENISIGMVYINFYLVKRDPWNKSLFCCKVQPNTTCLKSVTIDTTTACNTIIKVLCITL